MTSPLEKAKNSLGKGRQVGKEWVTHCPGPNHARGDQNPSLNICEGNDGKVLFNCRSGHCRPEEIIANMHGFEATDAFPTPYVTNGNGSGYSPFGNSTYGRLSSVAEISRPAPALKSARQIEARLVESEQLSGSVQRASEIEAEKVNWLWEPYIPLGMFSLIEGVEGAGKTWLLLAIATSISIGRGLRGIEGEHPKGSTLLVMTEDSAAHVIKPRLELMGADMDQILIHAEPMALDTIGGLSHFKDVLEKYRPVLVIFDPLFACTSGKLNLNADNEIRTVTSPLKSLAEEFGCAIVGVRHIGKGKGGGDPRAAGLNGVGWRAAARSVLIVGANPQNEAERGVVQTKCNLSAFSSKALGFTITETGFGWLANSSLTASTMLASFVHETHADLSEREEAVSFLRDLLKNGPVDKKTIDKEREAAGISNSTLRRAKAQLGVQSKKAGSGPWEWLLS